VKFVSVDSTLIRLHLNWCVCTTIRPHPVSANTQSHTELDNSRHAHSIQSDRTELNWTGMV